MRVDLDTVRQFTTPTPLTDQQFLTGIIELPAAPGTYDVSLVVTQTDGRGAVAHLGSVVVPGAGTRLTMSDLVLGREASGTRWHSGATVVPLNPLNTWSVGGRRRGVFPVEWIGGGRAAMSRNTTSSSAPTIRSAGRA